MKPLVPVITRTGLRRVFRADSEGLAARISHIAVGDRAYTPDGEETSLQNERARVPIAGGDWVGDHMIHLVSLLDGESAYWIKEVGIVLDDGTLLALWSDPDTPLAYKSGSIDLMLAFDLAITQLPKAGVEIAAGDVDMTLFFAADFARVGAAVIGTQRRIEELRKTLAEVEVRMHAIAGLAAQHEALARRLSGHNTQLDQLTSLAGALAALTLTNARRAGEPQ